ncbi:bifunctional UDP-sugar hydrolase/5'-nucleotidase [Isoptericola variabilis]|uniref:2',3'-cyclic-nucleotide 2'-phosphodiesterase n=1 Tax=Isoptericola variabilis (strain 225) TaxID=743718 RepID=F6FXF8_ISOV2|nr:5'-nucleotidase C-terminal domain-containing protein [Isoptericola variabilis]AEG44686.1 2',3'-cyclic-nucleotide 2'-phosphodiesterase [Isoptericola variabilis 225]TWH33456.1 2',3'-cyclic-nucleotide 2'-phosphodiesterase/3'-nucleotidase [Isoptericola variabilis J7]
MKNRASAAVAAALLVSLAAPVSLATAAPAPASSDTLDLTLLATTDLHGRVANWDYFSNAPYSDRAGDSVGLASVASVVDDVRAEVGPEQLLVVDNGDAIQGTPLSYYYAVQEPVHETGEVHPMAAAYDAIGYDAQVVGNHEFNYGLDLLDAYEDDLGFPLLGANVLDAETGEPALEPYTLVRRHVPGHKPVTVGILGLTTPGSAIWDKGNVEGRLEFQDMTEAAATWVPRVRAAGADVVVVLSHAGTGASSYDESVAPPENPSDVIARTVPGIDVMVVGHTHLDRPSQVVTNEVTGEPVLLTQPYRWGSTVSRVDLSLEKVRGQWDVAAAEASAIRTKDYPESQEILDLVAEQHETTVDYVNQVVAQSTEELSAVTSRYEDTPIIDFIQKVQTDTVDAALEGTEYADLPVLSIAAPFSRTAVFPAGDVSVRDIAGLYVYDNTLHAVTMTGAQVKDYLEYSNKYFATVPAGGTFDPARDTGAGNTPDYNLDILAGVEYEVDLSQPVGSRIENLVLADGTPLADDAQVVVAVNNYRRSGGGGFPHIASAPLVYDEQKEIRQLLIDWAQERGVIDAADFWDESWWLTVDGVRVP